MENIFKLAILKIKDISLLKVAVAAVAATFLPHTKSILILGALIGIDTMLGSWFAFKNGIFTSSGMKKTVAKIILYSAAIVSIKLIHNLVGPSIVLLVDMTFTYLSLIELKSVFENLISLGLPIKMDLINSIFNKIPLGKSLVKDFNITNKEITSQGDIIKSFISAVDKKQVARLMRVFWLNWRKFSEHIVLISDDLTDKDYLVNDLKLEIQFTTRTINSKLGEGTVNSQIRDVFSQVDGENVESLEKRLRKICNNEDKMPDKKNKMLREVTKYIQETLQDVLSKV